MGSAAAAPPPPKGFRRVYHLSSADHAISNIVFNRLKVARFSELNDPFELLALSFKGNALGKPARAYKDKLDQEQGLLCFSADWKDPVLWSHYAAMHTGICLGFNLKETLAIDVSYEQKRISGNAGRGVTVIDDGLAHQLLSTKFKSWKYEQEIRVSVMLADMAEQGSLFFYRFGKQLELAEVILGSLCSLKVGEVRELTSLHHPNAVTFQARLALGFFGIVPKESTVLPVTR